MSPELLPRFLQTPFMDAGDLRVRSYKFQFFALQTVHLSKCLLHTIISLAQALKNANSQHGVLSPVEKWTPVNGCLLVKNIEQLVLSIVLEQ
jgi:hypothetical protein